MSFTQNGGTALEKACVYEMKILAATAEWDRIRQALLHNNTVANVEESLLMTREIARLLTIKAIHFDYGDTEISPPTYLLEKGWHMMMLFPKLYNSLCHELFGELIDHDPLGAVDQEKREERREFAREKYTECFGQVPPPLFWGESANEDESVYDDDDEQDIEDLGGDRIKTETNGGGGGGGSTTAFFENGVRASGGSQLSFGGDNRVVVDCEDNSSSFTFAAAAASAKPTQTVPAAKKKIAVTCIVPSTGNRRDEEEERQFTIILFETTLVKFVLRAMIKRADDEMLRVEFGEQVLDPERTVVSYGVTEGSVLVGVSPKTSNKSNNNIVSVPVTPLPVPVFAKRNGGGPTPIPPPVPVPVPVPPRVPVPVQVPSTPQPPPTPVPPGSTVGEKRKVREDDGALGEGGPNAANDLRQVAFKVRDCSNMTPGGEDNSVGTRFFKLKIGTRFCRLKQAWCKIKRLTSFSGAFYYGGRCLNPTDTPHSIGLKDDDVILYYEQ